MNRIDRYEPLFILCRNGWEWLSYDDQKLSTTTDYEQYKINILGDAYSSTIVAIVSQHPDHLICDGCYGVLWLEAIYENERDGCLSYFDMKDMQSAIVYAEENLLRIGMPFTKDYRFKDDADGEKKKRNEELRQMYNLEELEKER